MKKQIIKSLIIILAIIAFCAIVVRLQTNQETLSDYAEKRAASGVDVGDTDAGNIDTENTKTDSVETKDIKTGDVNTENIDIDTGNTNTGNTDTGNTNVGDTNTGSVKTGDMKTGDVKTGNIDTGNISADLGEAYEVVYKEGFSYESLSQDIVNEITGISYPADQKDLKISYKDLSYVTVQYYDFDNKSQTGELVCNKAIASDLVEIFYDLYQANYQIDKIELIDNYKGDDDASCLDDNTSCFNYRVVEGSKKLSQHAYGLAIDINPFYNPYITYNSDGSEKISPIGSEAYADRNSSFSHKIDKNDLCYQLFIQHGFTWGGSWNSCKDYQHFQKNL